MNKENETYNSTEPVCKVHPNKRAKYKIIGIPCAKSKFYLTDTICSKCAVSLAHHQYKLEEIYGDQTQIRQEQLQLIIEAISQAFTSIDESETSLQEKRNKFIRYCELQKDKVKDYYHCMTQVLDNKLREQIDYLNDLQLKALNFFDQKHQEMKLLLSDLMKVYSDIEVNLNQIINDVDPFAYKQIMCQYQKNLLDTEYTLQKLESTYVYFGKVYLVSKDQKVLGGLLDDGVLEIKTVQTPILNMEGTYSQQGMSRILSPQSTQVTTTPTNQTPDKSRSNSQPSKFHEILNKVNENQIKVNNYYSPLLRRESSFDLSDRYRSPSFKK